jgi:hypothetical protein
MTIFKIGFLSFFPFWLKCKLMHEYLLCFMCIRHTHKNTCEYIMILFVVLDAQLSHNIWRLQQSWVQAFTIFTRNFSFLFLSDTGIWNQCLVFARQAFYHLSNDPRSFSLVYLSDRIWWFCQWWALDHNPPTSITQVAGFSGLLF